MFKITGLTALNVRALRETMDAWIEDGQIVLTATTASYTQTPDEALQSIDYVMSTLPGRGHPRHSLHAVRRKIERA